MSWPWVSSYSYVLRGRIHQHNQITLLPIPLLLVNVRGNSYWIVPLAVNQRLQHMLRWHQTQNEHKRLQNDFHSWTLVMNGIRSSCTVRKTLVWKSLGVKRAKKSLKKKKRLFNNLFLIIILFFVLVTGREKKDLIKIWLDFCDASLAKLTGLWIKNKN